MFYNKPKSVFKDVYYHPYKSKYFKLSHNAKDDEEFVQRLDLLKKLPIHDGCVNTICWNSTGEYILSGSDDEHLIITNGHDYKVRAKYRTNHITNIFSAKFMPDTADNEIVSCSGDGLILHTDMTNTEATEDHRFDCHNGTAYEVVTVPLQPSLFFSCGEDGTVRSFDLRVKTSCLKPRCRENVMIEWKRAVTAMAANPADPYHIAVGCLDSTVRLYDRRYLRARFGETTQPFCSFRAPKLEEPPYRITCIRYSNCGRDVLVSYSSDHLYLFNVQHIEAREFAKTNPLASEEVAGVSEEPTKRAAPASHPVRRLRLRGDWSDTGPNARPEREASTTLGQARPQLHETLMRHMTEVLARMLNDPVTRATLSGAGEEALEPELAERLADHHRGPEDERGEPMEAETAPARRDATQPSTSLAESSRVSSSLHQNLTILKTLREGFINRHCMEPSVSFKYSNQSTSNSTISLTCGSVNGARNTTTSIDVPSPSKKDDEEHVDVYRYKPTLKMKYVGHRNARTMIKEAAFWGDEHIMSGSDCGHVFVWKRATGRLAMVMQADRHVVNCLQPHATLPLLATSGIDHDVKLWAPIREQAGYDRRMAEELVARNEVMLEETRDTITVPAAFMIRMLRLLNSVPGSARRAPRTTGNDD